MYSALLQKVPIIIAGLFLISAVFTIYYRSKNVTKNEFLKFFKNANYLKAWVLIFVFILTAVFGVFSHLKMKQSVMAIIALNYSEASLAQNSNGTRYNMTEITCDEVIEKAIKMGAFEKVTVKQLKNCLSVYPYIQGDVSDKSKYHISTEFVVEYHASKHTEHLDAENVISLIASAYKQYYIDKYIDDFSRSTSEEKPDFSSMEYMDIVSYFDKETNSILNYLYGMAEKGQSFVTENNTTFNSIAGKVFQFKETQIANNLRSLILQHGVVKDGESYIDRLTYRNQNIDFDRRKNLSSYNLCNKAVDMYAEEMTRVVLVPTWDQSGKYYMGRTKVGIDELSVMATNFSDSVASNEKEIMDNKLVIQKMNTAISKSAKQKALTPTQEVENLINSIALSIENFEREAITAGREYANYRMNQCIAVSIQGFSLFSELKLLVAFAIFAYISIMLFSISKNFKRR